MKDYSHEILPLFEDLFFFFFSKDPFINFCVNESLTNDQSYFKTPFHDFLEAILNQGLHVTTFFQ